MDGVINIIDRPFNFLGQIDNYKSLIINKSYAGVGSFEMHLHESTTHTEKLLKENIIFTTPQKAYVILHRELNSVDGGLVVKGLEIKSYLNRLITFPPTGQAYHRISGNAETIMKEYVATQLTRKGITEIVVAPNQNRGPVTIYQTRYKNLAEELEKLSLVSGLGWDVALELDSKKFIFDVVEGQDRTAGQDISPPAIFSTEYDNIAEQTLIDSRLNYSNTAVVAGQGEGAEREITVVGDATGLDSFELFVDARDIENAADLPARGEQKLAEVQETLSFDSKVLPKSNLVYEEDFNLGDMVTLQNSKWGITADRRIAEITEVYEGTGFRLDVGFGESAPTLVEKLKQAIDTPIAEGGKSGEPGAPGEDGADGVGLNYQWDGTQLGVKREDETTYQYANLQGPQGPKGDTGPAGTTTWAGITDKPDTFPTANYTHNQITPANTWVIIHNLNKYPAITIVDSGGNTVVGETQYVSENQVKVNFTAAFAGKAYLN